jgi:hypothetical protein
MKDFYSTSKQYSAFTRSETLTVSDIKRFHFKTDDRGMILEKNMEK